MAGATEERVAEQVAAACRRAGLRVVGPIDTATGMVGAVVAHPFTSGRLDELDETIYRTVPTGREHTLVVLRDSAPAVLVVTWWQGTDAYCEVCSHYHGVDEPCWCPECGLPVPCKGRGGSH